MKRYHALNKVKVSLCKMRTIFLGVDNVVDSFEQRLNEVVIFQFLTELLH